MFGRRGQGAMEYLMTYGWAILVVMVVGIVMWQLGIFNIGGVTSTTSTGFPRIKPQLALIAVTNTDAELTFTNGAGGPISNVAFSGAACGTWNDPAGSIGVGENFNVNATGCTFTGSTGDPYDLQLSISYDVSIGGQTVTHTDVGGIRGPLE